MGPLPESIFLNQALEAEIAVCKKDGSRYNDPCTPNPQFHPRRPLSLGHLYRGLTFNQKGSIERQLWLYPIHGIVPGHKRTSVCHWTDPDRGEQRCMETGCVWDEGISGGNYPESQWWRSVWRHIGACSIDRTPDSCDENICQSNCLVVTKLHKWSAI